MLASLVLHALVLYFLPYFKEFRQARVPPPPLTAHLAKPKPPARTAESRTAAAAATRPVVRPAAPQAQAGRRAPSPVPPPPTPVLRVEPSKQAAEPALMVPAAPAQSAARVEVAPAAAGGPDPGTVARFRLELMEIARRYKRYPRIAQDNNWEGRVELRIAFAENGAIASMTVRKGHRPRGAGRGSAGDDPQRAAAGDHPARRCAARPSSWKSRWISS